MLSDTKKQTSDNYNEIRTLHQIKTDYTEYNKHKNIRDVNLKNLKFELEELSKKLRENNIFIDGDLGLKIQTQISDTLYNCLGKREKKLLITYENNK